MKNKEGSVSVNDTNQVAEGTAAAQTLVPKNATKTEMLAQMLRATAGMKREDLSGFLKSVLDQVGKEDETAPDNSKKNAASISMCSAGTTVPASTPYSVREDLDTLFDEGDELSEEFKTSVADLFEAAVANRVTLIQTKLEEDFEAEFEQKITEAIDEISEQNSTFMDYVARKWLDENVVQIENNIRLEHTEKFINGLKQLFTEHYIDVPDEKLDLVGDLEEKIAGLTETLENVAAENLRLTNLIEEAQREAIFDSICEDLTDTQVEKFKTLSENVEFSNADEYKSRLNIIKTKYFNESLDENGSTGLIQEEGCVGMNDESNNEVRVDPSMNSYLTAISRTNKK